MNENKELNKQIFYIHGQENSILSICQFFQNCFTDKEKPNQNPRKLFSGFQKTHPKVYMEKQKIQNSQHNIKEEQS